MHVSVDIVLSRPRAAWIALALAVVLTILLTPLSARAANDRVALVIGNADYQYIQKLDNPLNDATDIAAELEALGYDVTLATDTTREGMSKAFFSFSDRARTADIALVYYAGHAVQVAGKNYLLPIETAKPEAFDEASMRAQTWMLDDLLDGLKDISGSAIVFLDACRNDPFPKSRSGDDTTLQRGLFEYTPPGESFLVFYAAEAGRVALDGMPSERNSPFASAVLEALRMPGLEVSRFTREVRHMVRQRTNNQQRPDWKGALAVHDHFLGQPPVVPVVAGGAGVALPPVLLEKVLEGRTVSEMTAASLAAAALAVHAEAGRVPAAPSGQHAQEITVLLDAIVELHPTSMEALRVKKNRFFDIDVAQLRTEAEAWATRNPAIATHIRALAQSGPQAAPVLQTDLAALDVGTGVIDAGTIGKGAKGGTATPSKRSAGLDWYRKRENNGAPLQEKPDSWTSGAEPSAFDSGPKSGLFPSLDAPGGGTAIIAPLPKADPVAPGTILPAPTLPPSAPAVAMPMIELDRETLPRRDLYDHLKDTTLLVMALNQVNGRLILMGHGTGSFISDTHVLTNTHVVEREPGVNADAYLLVNRRLGISRAVLRAKAQAPSGRGIDAAVLEALDFRSSAALPISTDLAEGDTAILAGFSARANELDQAYVDILEMVNSSVFPAEESRPLPKFTSGRVQAVYMSREGEETVAADIEASKGASGSAIVNRCGDAIALFYATTATYADRETLKVDTARFNYAVSSRELIKWLTSAGIPFRTETRRCEIDD